MTATSVAADFSIDALSPDRVVRPETPEDVATALRAATADGKTVVPWGAGTKQSFGNRPRRYDIALDLRSLNGIIEYEPADLVVTVQAGTPIHALQERLATAGQFLPLDPPFAGAATIGGTLATNVSGPSRLLYGTARDMVLGLRVATPDGELVKSGGRVVKNVVGYDLNKLHVGALGTAGVVVEVTLKVQPAPGAGATVRARVESAEKAFACASDVVRSALYPRAVDVAGDPDGSWEVLVWASGTPATVERQVADVTRMLASRGVEQVERLVAGAHDDCWTAVREAGRTGGGSEVVLKLSCLPSQLAALAARAASVPGTKTIARAGNGVLYVISPADRAGEDAPVAGTTHCVNWIAQLAAAAHELGGALVVEQAPAGVRNGVDVWDPAGLAAQRRSDFGLMHAIKQQFDPAGTLNPGRFVDGI